MALPILDGNQTAATLSTVLTSGEHIPAHTVVSLGSQAITDVRSAVSGSVVSISNFPASQSTTFGAVTGSVSVLNLPSTQTIAGTVTANGYDVSSGDGHPIPLTNWDEAVFDGKAVVVKVLDTNGANLNFSTAFTVAGTVTVGNFDFSATGQGGQFATKSVQVGFISDPNSDFYVAAGEDYPFPVNIRNSVTVGSLPAISGTVTANNPSGALTTRFGSVTTANTAQITSAVTNTSRKYLLAQNISAGTVTIGIGFSPTTTQGIQLTAGGGLTFDAFCPTGAVYWLGAVTGAAFTILEG